MKSLFRMLSWFFRPRCRCAFPLRLRIPTGVLYNRFGVLDSLLALRVELCTAILLLFAVMRSGAADGDRDHAFGSYFSSTAPEGMIIKCVALQPDSKLIVGGSFNTANGLPSYRIARLNADSSLDTGFNPALDNTVNTIAVQPDGKILIGGHFTVVGGTSRNRIARLNSDGSLDTGFNPNANNAVYSMAILADGKTVIGGYFTNVSATVCNRVARLNPDGTVDTDFNPNANDVVNCMAIQADGRIVIGGFFTNVSATARNRIARLNTDGSLDTGFNPNANNAVYSMAIQADGKIVVGGFFTIVGSTPRSRIARIEADGTLDPGFDPNANSFIDSMTVQTDGKIVIGGGFTLVANTARKLIARLNADGTLDAGFNPNFIVYPTGLYVTSTAVQANGKLLIGGNFDYIARFFNSPATATLAVQNSTRVRWLRGGTAPETSQVWFEVSTNGTTWMHLGAGTRITGGWELTGQSLPAAGTIRARARITGGSGAGLVESLTDFPFGPEIGVSQPANTDLDDGAAIINFGYVSLAGGSAPKIFTITNSGIGDLILTNITKDGLNPGDFIITPLGATTLAPGSSTTFSATFVPLGTDYRSAVIHIASNDSDENPFDITLTGTAYPVLPSIGIQQPAGVGLENGVSSINYGGATVSSNTSKTFTVINYGEAPLTLYGVTKGGLHFNDFIVGSFSTNTLAPGASTTFNVAFFPTLPGSRSAVIHINSNDLDASPFDIALAGVGVPAGTPIVNSTLAWVQTGSQYAVAVDGSGNVIVAGFPTTKFAATDGALLWQNIGPTNGFSAAAMALDGSGNVLVTGPSYNGTNSDFYTAKYAGGNGALLWEKRFNSPGNFNDEPYALALDTNGNVIVTGVSYNGIDLDKNDLNGDYYTIKYAATDGTALWARRYDGPANQDDVARAVAVDASGNAVVTGASHNGTNQDFHTAKYAAADGATLWEHRYNGPANFGDEGRAVAVDSSGNVIVTGRSYNGVNVDGDGINPRAYTAKYASTNGALLWQKIGTNSANFEVAVDGDGNAIVAGGSFTPASNDNYYTAKYAGADGTVLWSHTYNGPGNDEDFLNDMAVDNDGNVVVTGESDGTNSRDYYTAKYAAANGALIWEKRYNGGQPDSFFNAAFALVLGPNGIVAVTGSSDSGLNTVVYWETLPPVAIALVPGGVQINFAGIPDRSYAIERAPSLDGPWSVLDTIIAPANGLIEYVDPSTLAGTAFYRTSTP